MTQKSIYIAGPMSGYPEFNFPAFNVAAHNFEFLGWKVWNPAAKDNEANDTLPEDVYASGDYLAANAGGFDFRKAYMWDIEKVLYSDAIFMLKGWENSKGAVAEHAVAEFVKKQNPEYQIFYEEVEALVATG